MIDGSKFDEVVYITHIRNTTIACSHLDGENVLKIRWQDGPITDDNPVNGCQVEHVLQIALNRLNNLDHESPCAENHRAMASILDAIGYLNQRTHRRIAEGTHKKHSSVDNPTRSDPE